MEDMIWEERANKEKKNVITKQAFLGETKKIVEKNKDRNSNTVHIILIFNLLQLK